MRLSATGWLTTVVALLVVALVAPTAPGLLHDLRGDSFPDVALAAGSLMLLGVAAWAVTITAVVLLGASSTVIAAVTPAFARRALLLGVSGALVVTPAHAAQQAPDQSAAEHARHTVDGLPLPDRPDVRPARHAASPTAASASAPAAAPAPRIAGVVEVRRGDTLWSIAARELPAGASDAAVLQAVRRWHDANRSVIGDDPDLIVPHQLLTPPSGKDRP